MLKADLERKILLQRGVHSYHESRIRVIALVLRLALLILPALIAFLAIADLRTLATIGIIINQTRSNAILGVLGFSMFIISVLVEILGIEERHRGHRRAVEIYTQLLRELRSYNANSEENSAIIMQLEKRYLSTAESSYKMTNGQFQSGEVSYRRLMARREAINREPYAWPWRIYNLSREISKNKADKQVGN